MTTKEHNQIETTQGEDPEFIMAIDPELDMGDLPSLICRAKELYAKREKLSVQWFAMKLRNYDRYYVVNDLLQKARCEYKQQERKLLESDWELRVEKSRMETLKKAIRNCVGDIDTITASEAFERLRELVAITDDED